VHSLNLLTVLEQLLRAGDEERRPLAYAALTHLRVFASEREVTDREAANRRLLALLTQLEALERAPPAATPPPDTKDPKLFALVARVLDALPILDTHTGVERLFRVVEAALGRRPPRPWRALVELLRANELMAAEGFAALHGATLLLAHAVVEARGGGPTFRTTTPEPPVLGAKEEGDA